MKLKRIAFKPTASLEFSSEEIDLLVRCAAVHYDGVCKDTVKPGGIISGIRNWNETCPGRPHDLKWREIDTLAKVLEVGSYINEGPTAFHLSMALRKVMTQLNDETPDAKEFTTPDDHPDSMEN
jgi:hypothetical protein